MEPVSAYTPDSFDGLHLCHVGVSGVVKCALHSEKQITEEDLKDLQAQCPASNHPLQALLYTEPPLPGTLVVDYTTVSPRPWLSSGQQQIGGAMCQHVPVSQADGPTSARASALRLLQQLKNQGLTIRSAFEAEFMMYEADGRTSFNNFTLEQYGRLDNMAGKEALLLDICLAIKGAGCPIETFMSEFGESQYEITFCPEEGIASADTIVIMKEALKSELKKHGASTSFMACSNSHHHANGFHFNHSLWTGDGKNAFLDKNDPQLMSDILRHWIAGVIHHAPALSALVCPTTNCFRRLEVEEMSPTNATWGIENRTTLLRIKNEKGNVYVENRLPSAACNPYLAFAGTVAAGLDGLIRKLECPTQIDGDNAPTLPKSMPEALDYLEKDVYMMEAIGAKIVNHLIQTNRQLLKSKTEGHLSSLNDEKEIYFHTI